jgi:uncharacterized protein (TIGR03435 family)
MIPSGSQSSLALLMVLAFIPALRAQIIVPEKGETLPTFEVATVKPAANDLGRSFHVSIWVNDNRFRTQNTTLRDLIRNAFDAEGPAQITGGPDAMLDSRWDINAKIGDDDFALLQKLPREDRNRALHLMCQALLADRFGLKTHVETREFPVFDLVLDKGGSKLQASAPEAPPAPNAATDPHASATSAPAGRSGRSVSTSVGHDHGKMTATDASLADLTTMLGRRPELDGRTVIDKTGLTGKYDWILEWRPLSLNSTDSDETGPSLFTALKEQLGLKLEPARGPVQIVVVDAVSAPSPN